MRPRIRSPRFEERPALLDWLAFNLPVTMSGIHGVFTCPAGIVWRIRVTPHGERTSGNLLFSLPILRSPRSTVATLLNSHMKTTRTLALIVITSAVLIAPSFAFASDTDDRIESAATKSYVFKTYLKHDSIKTDANDGRVVLTGTVSDSSHRALAESTVEGLPGVKSVDNQLTIKGEAPAEHSDTWIALKVRTVLLFHRNVSAGRTEVDVKDGVVTLRGAAASDAQRELTTEYAKDIDNVKEVKNEMVITSSPVKSGEAWSDKIDDASITAQVKMALMSHRSTSSLKTGVETTDGVVTLSGTAKNSAEKTLVTKLVTDVPGVMSVVNKMTVMVEVI